MSVGPVDQQAAADLQSTADFLFKVKALPAPLATAGIIDTSFQHALAD
jgi:NitT/TauT family transport system substrate-binding protein